MTDEQLARAESEAAADAAADAAEDAQALIDNDEAPDPANLDAEAPLTAADYTVAFSPRNVAIGLAIVAGVVAFAVSRRRRSGSRDRTTD
jgi:hypothetical protein